MDDEEDLSHEGDEFNGIDDDLESAFDPEELAALREQWQAEEALEHLAKRGKQDGG